MLKTYTINTDDPSDLKKHITILQKLRKRKLRNLGYNEVTFHSSKYSLDKIMPLIEGILSTDISSVYNLDKISTNYYVYAHCDPTRPINCQHDIREFFLATKYNLKHIPFYIGKGTGNRCYDLNRNDSHRKIRTKLTNSNKEISVVKLYENLTAEQAICFESKLIDILGLRALNTTGYLVNLDEGVNANKRRLLYPPETRKYLKVNGYSM